MGFKVRVVLVVFLALFGHPIFQLLGYLDLFKLATDPHNDGDCKLHQATVTAAGVVSSEGFAASGMEDIVYVRLPSAGEELAGLTCSGDHDKYMNRPGLESAATPMGECVLLKSDGSILPLPLDGFPPGVHFHAHGIYVSKKSKQHAHHPQRVFVINHAFGNGGERVEVFQLQSTTQQDRAMAEGGIVDASGAEYVLHHEGSINPPFFSKYANGVFNDLVVDPTQSVMYITKYMIYPEGTLGRKAPENWQQKFRLPLTYGQVLLPSFLSSGANTTVVRCHLPQSVATSGIIGNLDTDDKVKCSVVADNLIMANGLNDIRWNNKHLLFVNDVVRHQIRVYDTSHGVVPKANPPLKLVGTIQLHHALDNIETSQLPEDIALLEQHGIITLYGGAIVNISAATKLDHHPHAPSPGGITRIRFSLKNVATSTSASGLQLAGIAEQEVVIHKGFLFAGTASGMVLPDHRVKSAGDDDARLAIMGSWLRKGVLQCGFSAGGSGQDVTPLVNHPAGI